MPWIATPVVALVLLAASPTDVERALDDTLGDSSYQTTLPGMDSPAQPAAGRSPFRGESGIHLSDAGPLSTIASALFWAGVVVVVVLALLWLSNQIIERRANPDLKTRQREDESASRGDGEQPLADADALASAGRFADAIHVLLLRALERLATRSGLADSWTSREVLQRVKLGPVGQRAFEELVQVVEVAHFGRRPVDRAVYDRCVSRYDELSRDLGGRAR